MDFLTAYYRQSDAGSVSLLLQQYCLRGRHVCFACLTDDGRAGAYMTEQLLFWFRELHDRKLTKSVKSRRGGDRLGKELKKRILRAERELRGSGLLQVAQHVNLVGILCVDEIYLFFQQGARQESDATDMQETVNEGDGGLSGYLLNTFFGKTSINQLSQPSMLTECGILERDIGILLTTDSFYNILGENTLKGGLCLSALQSTMQVEKYLAELGKEGEHKGGQDMAAVLIKTCEEKETCKRRENSKEPNEHRVSRENEYRRDGKAKRLCKGIKRRGTIKEKNGNVKKQSRNIETQYKNAGKLLEVDRNTIGTMCESKEEWGGDSMQGKFVHDKTLVHNGKCYSILGVLGKGAFAHVYKVSVPGETSIYACKVSGHKEMLWQEFHVMKTLQHPLFPQVYEYWECGEFAVMRMEYVSGENLQSKLEKGYCFSTEEVIHIGMDVAEGLLMLHEKERGLLFRDVKPENIMMTGEGRVKLLDFGCVCEMAAESKSKAGSPGFAAPEQFAEGKIDVTADVYGLGRTMETLLENGGGCKLFGVKGKLYQLIKVCTRASAAERLPDMRSLLLILGEIAQNDKGRGLWRKRKLGREWRMRSYQKNIWQSAQKRA